MNKHSIKSFSPKDFKSTEKIDSEQYIPIKDANQSEIIL